MQGTPSTILIIRLSSIGDIVLASPLIRALRGRFPGSRIDFLVKAEYAPLVRHNPHLSRVIEFPASGTLRDLGMERRRIRDARYDLIVDIHDSVRSRLLTLALSNTVRVNKRKHARSVLIRTKRNIYHREGGAPGVAERYMETVRALGVADDAAGPEIFIPDAVRAEAMSLLHSAGVPDGSAPVGICPSAHHNNKIWLSERFAEAAAALASDQGAPVLIFGAAADAARCAETTALVNRAAPGACIVNLAGRTSLLAAAALLERCAVVITNDTGLMHIATAVKRNVVAVFGPTVKEFGFFPMGRSKVVELPGLYCRPCTHVGLPSCPEGHFRCMRDLTAGAVIDAARSLLAGS